MLALLPTGAALLSGGMSPVSFASPGPDATAEEAVAAALKKVVKKEKAPLLLRLAFHDAGTFRTASADGGPNGSIQYELDRPESKGLRRGWKVILEVRNALKGTAGENVSDGDLIAAAGAYGVALCGGPKISVPLGRTQASGPDPNGRMLSERASSEEQKVYFTSVGLSLQEAVALLGGHTLGNKGYGDTYTFDNIYFKELLRKPWANPKDEMASMIGIPSDHVLPDDTELLPFIQRYADDQPAFFEDFAAAYVKMTSLGYNFS